MISYQERIKDLTSSYGNWFHDDTLLERGKMTSSLYPYTNLFSPITINKTKIKNRLIMAPMGNISMCDESGRPSEKMISYFTERAKGGVGLITTGLIPISYGIDNSIIEKGDLTYFPRIDRSRTTFAPWRDIAENCHSFGAKIFLQISPGLGRVGNPQCLVSMHKFPVSASFNPNYYMPGVPSLRLSDRKLKKIIKKSGQAAADSKAALIDGVYLHGHEGYLLEQLTNPAFNRRKLGRYSDWQRFGIELVKEIRNRCGKNYPIMYRIDLSLVLNETYGEKMSTIKSLKKFKNERTVEMTLDYMKNLVKAGVDIFDVDLGCYDNWWLPHPPGPMPPGCFLEVSKIVKEYFDKNNIQSNAGIEVPIAGVGKLGYPDLAEQALRDNSCDMIMLGRPLLSDPYWPNKVYANKVDEIIPCIGCQEGCINEFVEGGHPQCAINPRTGFENIYEEEFPNASNKKKIAVIGSGPAGVTCAVTAAKRGHEVTLIDKNDKAGGLLISGGVPKIKFDIQNYNNYLSTLISKTCSKYELIYRPNTTATVENLKTEDFDVIVTAIGVKQIIPKLPGYDKDNVVLATELLLNKDLAKDCKNIVVIGGGVVGCETAYMLKSEMDKTVDVIEMDHYFMNHVCTANRGYMIHYLEENNVKLHNCTKLKSIEEDGIIVIKNISKTVPDPYITWAPLLPENVVNPLTKEIISEEKDIKIEADLVVMAIGGRPIDTLYYDLVKANIAPEIYNIGDSFKQGKVFEATKSGYLLARNL
ncbi:FAD-dependent oxidoreductase [Vallitalea guaymasensis]|uniref:FAD-dependent oxidoreductase n=1 Tax=Vallitalea guaymasensis TaxID=1185412 RepID=UPI00187D3E26|nr:FAD-dependent oxidoreductase [Vallitalea guaymasensis]